jgi:hypothetical protein
MPAMVRALHDLSGDATWVGEADVTRGQSVLSRAAAALFSLPPEGPNQPLRVTFQPVNGRERWSRSFGNARFRSLQYEHAGLLCERVGPSCLAFSVAVSPEDLVLKLQRAYFLGVPLPRFLHPIVRTSEFERDGLYRFEVEAHLPLIGLLVRYAGWLRKVAT